ncbi:IS200/IS605 family accessory protein TnpB-related protein [Candidatus Uabimicrobium amorphum]|uniref:IS200/IS605 family accessory protein TnpB-related protein n=1 Tax=Uabimicrobium amorphum TaxID=2596890 RepID=UPI0034A2DBF2
MRGEKLNELKKIFISEKGMMARQFNSLHSEVKGIIKAAKELQKINVEDVQRRSKSLKRVIKKLSKALAKSKKDSSSEKKDENKKLHFVLHHKKRKLRNVENRIAKLKKRGICLGGRKLFKKQFHLEENGYENHQQWLEEFRTKRVNRIFFIGSKDESFGNQNCQLLGDKLKVRVAPSLEREWGKYVNIPVKFSYKQETITAALKNQQAINYRFVKKENDWYLFVTTKEKPAPITTKKEFGTIGVDLNHSHVAFAETNRHGNLANYGKIHTPIQDRSSEQVKAMLAEACKEIITLAKKQQKPVVIEKLDFSKKKKDLSAQKVPYRRMISYFAYKKFASLMKSQGARNGVEIIEVNPAYSSIIGKYKFAYFLGISLHIAASFVLARRALNYSERLPARTARCLPVDRHCHVWKYWAAFTKIAASNRGSQVELFFCSRHIPF